MNREIKFRAWDGTKMVHSVLVGQLGAFYAEGLDPKDTACISPFNTKYPEEVPIMQYTGLKDKNGKEIFEGDIISNVFVENTQSVVEYDLTYAQFTYGAEFNVERKANEIEVIGNIYETPELLTE